MLTVNLAPAEIRKIGSGFDLPIAACILGAWEVFPPSALEDDVLGGLSLEGGCARRAMCCPSPWRPSSRTSSKVISGDTVAGLRTRYPWLTTACSY